MLSTAAFLMKSLKADGLMSWKWCLDGTYRMAFQSWFIAVPAQLLRMADGSSRSELKKAMYPHYIPTQKYRDLMANLISNSQALVAEIFVLEEG